MAWLIFISIWTDYITTIMVPYLGVGRSSESLSSQIFWWCWQFLRGACGWFLYHLPSEFGLRHVTHHTFLQDCPLWSCLEKQRIVNRWLWHTISKSIYFCNNRNCSDKFQQILRYHKRKTLKEEILWFSTDFLKMKKTLRLMGFFTERIFIIS
jgi:predicted nucleic acid-binding Zn ribbon protein